MIIALKRSLLLLVAVLMCSLATAGRVDNLYEVQLPVAGQSPAVLKEAAAIGLEKVFVRVSGHRQLVDSAVIAAALASPEPFLTRYRYQRQEQGADAALRLDMSFSPRQVNAVLQSAGLPVWSANRPGVLLWMVVDTDAGRQFLGAGAYPELEQALREEVRRRGLSLQLPLLDLVDAGNLSAQQLWQMSEQAVRAASVRYAPPFILMGRASQFSTGQWLASWALLDEQSSLRFDTDSLETPQFLAAAIDRVADVQARRYAVSSAAGARGRTLIHIGGLQQFGDYAQLISYLESLAVVEHANAAWMTSEELVLELVLKDDMEKVRRYLQLDGRLRELSGAQGSTRSPLAVTGYYRWVGGAVGE